MEFKLDPVAAKIVQDTSIEMVNAMVSIALKKFSTTQDFIDYFVESNLDDYIEKVQEPVQNEQPQEDTQFENTNTTSSTHDILAQPQVISFEDF